MSLYIWSQPQQQQFPQTFGYHSQQSSNNTQHSICPASNHPLSQSQYQVIAGSSSSTAVDDENTRSQQIENDLEGLITLKKLRFLSYILK